VTAAWLTKFDQPSRVYSKEFTSVLRLAYAMKALVSDKACLLVDLFVWI
jgi:hypothetical protein